MRVAGRVGNQMLRPGEQALGVDEPVCLVERLQKGVERGLVGEARVLAEELEPAGVVRGLQHQEDLATEHPLQNQHRQQTMLRAADPLRSVDGYPADGPDRVRVRVMRHR